MESAASPSSATYELNYALRHLGHALYVTFYPPGYMQYLLIHPVYYTPPLRFFDPLSICFFVVLACRPLREYQKLMYIFLSCYLYQSCFVLYCDV
jgi:hypothetical protein